jgi:hypothetical protein
MRAISSKIKGMPVPGIPPDFGKDEEEILLLPQCPGKEDPGSDLVPESHRPLGGEEIG